MKTNLLLFEIPEYQNLEWHGQGRLSLKLKKWTLQSESKEKKYLVRIIVYLIDLLWQKTVEYNPNAYVFIFICK